MESEHRNGYSNPHWKAAGFSSYEKDVDGPGSFRLPARALNIIWGNDPRFWQWTKLTDEDKRFVRFEEGALLLQVNWIEVTGKLELPSLKLGSTGKYKIYYMVKFRADAFGWHSVPVKFKVRHNREETQNRLLLESYREKHDVWHEIPGGEFSVAGNNGGTVEFGMYEVESDWWKGSMVLGGIKVLPAN
ncbi:hypothetical protein L1049_010728 [Liquidambar formosana]|uniref:Phloem protein 2 n=1 Tax=Liquidambar formosana TaxID=63359 RepID=A0AAP0N874_LIQFO